MYELVTDMQKILDTINFNIWITEDDDIFVEMKTYLHCSLDMVLLITKQMPELLKSTNIDCIDWNSYNPTPIIEPTRIRNLIGLKFIHI